MWASRSPAASVRIRGIAWVGWGRDAACRSVLPRYRLPFECHTVEQNDRRPRWTFGIGEAG